MRGELQEQMLNIEALTEEELELLARRLLPFLAPRIIEQDEKRLAALEKEVHRLSKEIYKLRLEMSEQPDLDFDRR